ncbi:keratin-associated protein 10-4-like [Daphnia pulex]|uniref:keratin-associated protein 10-4-like n=1 Tax=Daphnia pulex TaxID=6669 RepID=UPI001EDDFA0E|nr:keratin-associated protein 10-4-like [Daphnia pulex]
MARTSVLCQLLLVSCCISLVVVNAMPMPSSYDSSESVGCSTGGCQPTGCPTGGCQPVVCQNGGCPGNEERDLEIETSREAEQVEERVSVSVEEIEFESEDPATGCIDASCRNQGAARRPVPCTVPTCTPVAPRRPVPCTGPTCRPVVPRAPAPCTSPTCTPVAPPAPPCPTCKTTTTTCTNCAPTTCTTPGCATA